VSAAFSSGRPPSWGLLELLVEAMDGDVDAFRRLWLAATDPEPAPAASAPLIAGRSEELGALRRHLEDAPGELLLVMGEAGMGKSRLVRTVQARSRGSPYVAEGYCLPLSTDVPLLPVADVLRSVHEADGGRWLGQALVECPPYVAGALRRLLPELDLPAGPSPAPDDDWSRQHLFSAVEGVLTALARSRPLAVLVEDLHWADATTLDLLEHLLARRVGVPVVGTWRLEDPTTPTATSEWCVRLRRLPTVHTLVLGPLTRAQTAEQLELLAAARVDPALASRIHRRSEGQPLFTEQLWAQDDDQPLPRLLGELLDRRIEGLGHPAAAIVRALGVADRSLSGSMLAAVTGLPPPELAAGLHELEDRHLLRQGDVHDVALRHPLLAEAVRRGLVAPELVEQHRRVAAALAGSADASPAEVAAHWERAEEPAHEIVWRIRAARAAGLRFALAEEAAEWRRVLALWPEHAEAVGSPPLRRCDAYLAAMDALGLVDVEGGATIAREALHAVVDPGSTDAADVYQRVATFEGALGDPEGALELLDRAIRVYESTQSQPGLVQALGRRSTALSSLGRYDEAVAALSAAAELGAAHERPERYRALLAHRAAHLAESGEPDAALATLRAAQAVVPEPADPLGDCQVAVSHTHVLGLLDAGADEVVNVARPVLASAAVRGLDDSSLAVLRGNVSRALRLAGRVREAAEIIDPVTEDPVTADRWATHSERGLLDLLRGRLVQAAERIDALARIFVVDLANRTECAADPATVDLWSGRPTAALEHLGEVLGETVELDDPLPELGNLFVLAARAAADVAAADGLPVAERTRLAGELDDLLARAARDPFAVHPTFRSRAARAATWAAERARLLAEAPLDGWAAAAREWDRLTRPHDAAYCRWRAAEVALGAGQGTVARRLLARATRDAREHVPLLRAIEDTRASAAPAGPRR
jgi:tetratricopeptide (TPR) repeat protein